MKAARKPGGVLLVLDLFEPAGLLDSLSNLLALPVSVGLRLIHHGRLLPRREERAPPGPPTPTTIPTQR